VILLNRRPAPPHNNMASGMLGICPCPLRDERSVVHLLRLMQCSLTTFISEGERNAQQLFQSHPQGLPPLGRHVEKHKATAASAQELTSQSAGTEPGLVDLIDADVVRLGLWPKNW